MDEQHTGARSRRTYSVDVIDREVGNVLMGRGPDQVVVSVGTLLAHWTCLDVPA